MAHVSFADCVNRTVTTNVPLLFPHGCYCPSNPWNWQVLLDQSPSCGERISRSKAPLPPFRCMRSFPQAAVASRILHQTSVGLCPSGLDLTRAGDVNPLYCDAMLLVLVLSIAVLVRGPANLCGLCHHAPFEYEYQYRCTEYGNDFPDERGDC